MRKGGNEWKYGVLILGEQSQSIIYLGQSILKCLQWLKFKVMWGAVLLYMLATSSLIFL